MNKYKSNNFNGMAVLKSIKKIKKENIFFDTFSHVYNITFK